MSAGAPSLARDLREGGRWSPTQRLKNDALWALTWTAIATFGRLPPRALRAGGALLGVIAHAILPRTRELARDNVRRAFPELTRAARDALVARTYRTLGRHLGDAVSMLDARRPNAPLPFAPGAREALAAAAGEGRGVILASAHLVPWERVAAGLAASGLPFVAVTREAYDPRMTRLYDRLRKERGVRTIARGGAAAARDLLRALRRGEILGIPMDLASRVPSVEAPFLGVPAPTAVGPARLALRTQAEVVVALPAPAANATSAAHATSATNATNATSDAGRATGATHATEIVVIRVPSRDLPASHAGEIALTTRINDTLSAGIRAMPEAWVWMHRRWPSPAPSPAPTPAPSPAPVPALGSDDM